jgi:hypothetical protein
MAILRVFLNGAMTACYNKKAPATSTITRLPTHNLRYSNLPESGAQYLAMGQLAKVDTVRRELAIVQHCLKLGTAEWGIALPSNPVSQIKLPAPGRARERRTTPAELERLLASAVGRAPLA